MSMHTHGSLLALLAVPIEALDAAAMDEIPAVVPFLSTATSAKLADAAHRTLRRMASTCSPREVVLALLASCGEGGATLRSGARVEVVALLGIALKRVSARRRAPLLRDVLDALASFVCFGPAAEPAPWEAAAAAAASGGSGDGSDAPAPAGHALSVALAICNLHAATTGDGGDAALDRAFVALLLPLLPAAFAAAAAAAEETDSADRVLERVLRCAVAAGLDGARLLQLGTTHAGTDEGSWIAEHLPRGSSADAARARALSVGCVAHALLVRSSSLWALPAIVAPSWIVLHCVPLIVSMLAGAAGGGGGGGASTAGGSCYCDAVALARLATLGVQLLDAALALVPPASLAAPMLMGGDPPLSSEERRADALDGARFSPTSVAACCVPLIEYMVTAEDGAARQAAHAALQRLFDALQPRRRLTLLQLLVRRSPRPVVTALLLDRARAECVPSIRSGNGGWGGNGKNDGDDDDAAAATSASVFGRAAAVGFVLESLSSHRDPIVASEVYTSGLNMLRLMLLFSRRGASAAVQASLIARVAPLLKTLALAVDARTALLTAQVTAARAKCSAVAHDARGRPPPRLPSSSAPRAPMLGGAAGAPFIVETVLSGTEPATRRVSAAERQQGRLALVQEVLSRVRELL